jgi:hypothetical protein
MKKQDKSKLRLDRETVAPLQAQVLDAVNGGVWVTPPPTGTTSIRIGQWLATKLLACK